MIIYYPPWCVAVLDSYDDGDYGSVCVCVIILSGVLQCWTVMMMAMVVVCVCHYPLWCVVVLDSYDDGDDGSVCVSLPSLVCCSVGQL